MSRVSFRARTEVRAGTPAPRPAGAPCPAALMAAELEGAPLSGCAARRRSPHVRLAEVLLARRLIAQLVEPVDDQVVEGRRPLDHRGVTGVVEHDLAGLGDQALVLVRVALGHE